MLAIEKFIIFLDALNVNCLCLRLKWVLSLQNFNRPAQWNFHSIQLYFAGAIFCFMTSMIYRSLSIWGPSELAKTWQLLDRIGILILVWSSTLSFVQIGFTRNSSTRRYYSWMLTLAATVGGLSVTSSLGTRWPGPCLLLGLAALIPIIHATVTSCNQLIISGFLRYMAYSILGGLCYLGETLLGWDAINLHGQILMHVFCLSASTTYSAVLCEFLIGRRIRNEAM
jgi:predicted membrane channel-forming protein YqfA (hemolysin III family)